MKKIARWSVLSCLLLLGCSHSMLVIEQQAVNSHLLVVELSDEGSIKQEISRVRLPYAVGEKSSMMVRDNRVYIGSYGWLHLFEQNANGVPELASSLHLKRPNVAFALHPEKPIVYLVDEKSITIVNAVNAADLELAQYLMLVDEIKKIPQHVSIMDPAGTDIACENEKLAVTVEFLNHSSGISGAVLIFDVSEPLTPRIERILGNLPGALSVAMGLYDHQILVVGNKVSQYRNFAEERPQHGYPDGSWLQRPPEDSGWVASISVPGRVVETQLVLGPVGDGGEKSQVYIKQHAHSDASGREQLRLLAGLDHGILYVATQHVLAHYNTKYRHIVWKYDTGNVSDYFERLYGLAMRGHGQAFLAAGKSGVCFLKKSRHTWFTTQANYNDVPGPVLDVCVAGNQLYILCGE